MTGSPLEIRVENMEHHAFHRMKLHECFKYVHIPFLNTGTVFRIGDTCGYSIVFRIATDLHDPDVEKTTSIDATKSVCSVVSSLCLNGKFTARDELCVYVNLANGRTIYPIIESISAPNPCPRPDTRLPLHKKILNIPFDAFRRKTLGQCLMYGEQLLLRSGNARLTVQDECGNFVRFCMEETKPKDEKPVCDDLEVGMLNGQSFARTKYVARPYGTWAFLEAFDVTMVPNATKEAVKNEAASATGEVTMERATMATLQKIIVDNNLHSCTIVDLKGPAGNFIHVYYQPTPPTQENWCSENYRYWYIGLRMDDTVSKAREMVKHIAEVKAPTDIVQVYAGNICVDFTGMQ